MKNLEYIFAALALTLTGCSGTKTNQVPVKDSSDSLYLLVGSYSPADSAGIKVYSFDMDSASATKISELSGISNPSYQTVSADGEMIYSVSEDNGNFSGACAISFDRDNGKMDIINISSTEGGAPCYISVSPDGRYVVTANYLGGNITVFPLDSTGKLLNPQPINFGGNGPVSDRQDQPHLHCISFTPDSRFLLATDLGTDRIHKFATCSDSLLNQASMTDIELLPGSGPRHIVWDAPGKHAYLVNELSGAVTVFDYDGTNLVARQYIQADTTGVMGSADIHISNDGRFLYASNRLKNDGIAIFTINQDDGMLSEAGYQITGPHPRNFIITPDDRFLLVACRDSDTIEIYSRDSETGLLSPTNKSIRTSKPVSLKWL